MKPNFLGRAIGVFFHLLILLAVIFFHCHQLACKVLHKQRFLKNAYKIRHEKICRLEIRYLEGEEGKEEK